MRVAFVQANRSTVRIAALNCNVDEVSAQLYDTGYYQGFGKTREERIANHQKADAQRASRCGSSDAIPKSGRSVFPFAILATAGAIFWGTANGALKSRRERYPR